MTTSPYSFSQISTFLRCQQQWYLQYIEKIRRLQIIPAMGLGSAVHAGLAAYFSSRSVHGGLRLWAGDELGPDWNDYVSITDSDDMEIGDEIGATIIEQRANQCYKIVAEAYKIISYYTPLIEKEWEVSPIDGKYSEIPVSSEDLFVADVGGSFIGFVDIIMKHKETGAKFIVDFKTRQKIQPHLEVYHNMQLPIYQFLLSRMGHTDITGVAICQLRSALPRQPKLNKNGSMSRADVVTDWPTYEAALMAAGLNPVEYGNMQLKLEAKQFMNVQRIFYGPGTSKAIWQNVENIMDAIRKMKYRLNVEDEYNWADHGDQIYGNEIPRNMSNYTCTNCQMREICISNLEGQPTEHYFESGLFVRGDNS